MKKGLWEKEQKMYFWRTQNTQNTHQIYLYIYQIYFYTFYANGEEKNQRWHKKKK